MKQLVQDIRSGEARVVDVPVPMPGPGQVLIEVAASVVSPGTERSVVSFGQKNLVAKALTSMSYGASAKEGQHHAPRNA